MSAAAIRERGRTPSLMPSTARGHSIRSRARRTRFCAACSTQASLNPTISESAWKSAMIAWRAQGSGPWGRLPKDVIGKSSRSLISASKRPLWPTTSHESLVMSDDHSDPEDGDLVEPSPACEVPKNVAEAVRTMIRWAGDDPDREGLLDTPGRVVRAYEEFFAGYAQDPSEVLSRTFSEVEGYDEMVVMTDIRFESHCEHHMVPIIGKAHVGYLPDKRVVGISKLARLVEVYARRLQVKEKMTVQIADTLP